MTTDGRIIVHPSAHCSLYRKCPYSYRLHLEGAPASRDMRPPFEGSLCQAVLDRWFLENRLTDPDFPRDALPPMFARMFADPDLRLLPGETRESLFTDCVRLLGNYIGMLRQEKLLTLDGVRTEFRYGWDDAPLPMTRHWAFAGASDYHKEDPTGDEIYDGKCSRRVGSCDPMQIYMYAVAAEKRLGRPVKAVHLLYYRQMVKVSYPFDEKTRQRTYTELEQTCIKIKNNDLPATPGAACRICRYRKTCPERVGPVAPH